MKNKKPDPYPVTIADIEKQREAIRAADPRNTVGAQYDACAGLMIRAKDSGPFLIQHR